MFFDYRILIIINESSEEEIEVRVGLNKKKFVSCRFFGCEERLWGRIDNSVLYLSFLVIIIVRYSLVRFFCFVLV